MHGRTAALLMGCLFVLAACDSGDSSVKVYNTNPNASITYPTNGSSLDSDTDVTMSGTGSDPESAEDALKTTWTVDGVVVCDTVNLDSTGITECITRFDPGSYTIGLTVTDPSGGSTTVTHAVLVNPSNGPEVEITAPVATGVYYADRATSFEGLVSDAEDSPDSLIVAWASDRQGDLGLGSSASASGVTAGDAVLDQGTHQITLSATDSDGLTSTDSVMVTVLDTNAAPSCEITNPSDGGSDIAGAMVDFEGTASDSNIASEYLTARWESDRDGIMLEESVSADGETAHSTDSLGVGTHLITLTVVDDAGEPCTDSILYTVGTPPVVTIDAPFDGDVVNEGVLITFLGTANDLEDSGVDIDIQWSSTIDGTLDESPPDASSGVLSFTSDELQVGEHEIRLRATDRDGLYSDATIVLQINGLPSAPAISIAPDPAVTGDDLVASVDVDSSDAEGDAISYAYDWTVGGVASSITSTTVPAASTSRGEVWQVTVTPFDGLGSGASATASVTIQNTPPSVDSAPSLGPDPAYEGDVLECTLGSTSDDDGDPVSDAYSWFVNSAPVAATSSNLGSTFFDAGDSVYCQHTPNDGYDDGTAVASNVVVIANTAPTVSGVLISPDPATAADTLTCSYSYSDADSDADSSAVAWTVNGTPAGTGTTLSSGFVRGDTVECEVTPNDGTDDGTPASDSITISNSAPEITTVEVTPDPAVTGDALSCTVTASSDVDGDALTYSYAWYVNGASVGVTSTTLDSAYHVKNDNAYCLVTPNDGFENGDAVQSNVVTTGNTVPVTSSVTLSPSSPGTEDSILASPSSSDADSDTITHSYDWYVTSAYVATTTTGSLDGSYFVRGDSVYVEVTANDGTDDGSPVTSSSVTIANTLPTAPGLVFDPPAPEQAVDDIICDIDSISYDADADSVSYTFSWTVDGAAYTSATSSSYTGDTVPAADTALGFDWICTVTPNDGFGDGTAEAILVTVIDVTDPDAPTLDTPTRFRNEDDMSLTGTCIYDDCVDVVVECVSASSTTSDSVACQSDDSFATTMTGLTRGETTLCNAYCVDGAGNESSDSNTVSTDVCDPEDTYEDDVGTGDADSSAIEPWAIIDDSGASAVTVSANILGSDSVDWYLVETSDDVSADSAAKIDYYSLDVRLLDADTGVQSTDYLMTVYKGAPTISECASSSGYTAYTDYVYDNLDGSAVYHITPSDRRQCEVSNRYNDCEDFSNTYYIRVDRVSSSITSCAGYEVSVTNNGGVCNTSTECPN